MDVLEPKELVLNLRETLRNRHPIHPLRKLLLTGKLSKEQIQGWAKNQFHEFHNIHRFFGIRYQKCPIPELRRALIENMVEEEGEDIFGGKHPSHAELWIRFGEATGIPRDEMQSYEPLPGVKAALEMYVHLVQQSSWAVAIGTGLVFEGEGPKRMGEERQALEKHYQWIPSEGLEFFRAHEYHDEGHGNFIVDVIKNHIMEKHLQDEMRVAVETRVDTMWLQSESIYEAFVRPSLSPDVVHELEARPG